MTTTINASTSSGLVVTPDNSGNVLLQYNGQSAPAFSAVKSGAAQSIPNNAWTKVTFDVEEFDTNNNFSSSTFTPTVAGYYQINASINWASGTGAYEVCTAIYKNGSNFKIVADVNSSVFSTTGAALIYCNGTTDYLEVYGYQGSGSAKNVQNYTTETWFQGCLLRGA